MASGLNVRKAQASVARHISSRPKLIYSRFCDFRIDDRPEFLSSQHKHTALADRVWD